MSDEIKKDEVKKDEVKKDEVKKDNNQDLQEYLLDWIDASKIPIQALSMNSNAVDFLDKKRELINWNYLSSNESAVYLLEEFPEKINYEWLGRNMNAIHLIEENLSKSKLLNVDPLSSSGKE